MESLVVVVDEDAVLVRVTVTIPISPGIRTDGTTSLFESITVGPYTPALHNPGRHNITAIETRIYLSTYLHPSKMTV